VESERVLEEVVYRHGKTYEASHSVVEFGSFMLSQRRRTLDSRRAKRNFNSVEKGKRGSSCGYAPLFLLFSGYTS
jgi:hypothetical protein